MTGKRRAGKDPVPEPRPQGQRSLNPPPPPSMVIAPQLSRRQARLERKKQKRKRVGFAGGAAIAAGIVVVIVVGILVGHHVASNNGGPKRTQQTLLVQLQADDHTAEVSALLAHDPANNQGVEVLVPSRLITDVCGYNSLNFGDALALPNGATASRQALSAMLGSVTIDGSWILQQAQLRKLVNLLGGITADVDVDVVRRTGGGGGKILIPAGPNVKLNGTQAVEYAKYVTSPHADASAELARLQQVLDATVTALPRSPTAIAALLRQLGPGGGSTLGATKLASFLLGFANSERATGKLLPTDIPYTQIDTGGTPSYRINSTSADQLVTANLASSVPEAARQPRVTVELLNGVGTPGLVATTCPRLLAHNIVYVGSDNAASFNYVQSRVEVSNSKIAEGYAVAKALRLPSSDVRRTTENQSVADVIVTLGRDYNP